MYKLIVLDLDGTLLHSDKTISEYTASVLKKCRSKGIFLAIATARGESNAEPFIRRVEPDLLISSDGALVKWRGEIIYSSMFSEEETKNIIEAGFEMTGRQCEITVDTLDAHYWNYREDPHVQSPDWGSVVYTNYRDFNEKSLKICLELPDARMAEKIAEMADCDFARFSDGNWYKFSKKEATKLEAVRQAGRILKIPGEQMAAFGDDFVDVEMIKYCGLGAAMGNAIAEVKHVADAVVGTNDEDGVAHYLESALLPLYT